MGANDTTGPESAAPTLDATNIIFYDGACGLCHASVRFAVRRDPSAVFRYAPLFGDAYRALQLTPNLQTADLDLEKPPDSLLLLSENRVLIRSAAVARLLSGLQPPWPIAGRLLRLIPRPLADVGYRTVALLRRQLFAAPKDACPLVPVECRDRFLP